ncbi:hypothetical protein D7D52_27495 [Nocardia yunnanensis]|uniref:Uncharacterized protein n=1 Tax=Nocardia yunnanensis TaxID=2382165 RepID=A0A386ZHR4_9NOCA|nr:hypothetical protein [Nocardia yunnanensis]AYF76930.1 hypothetical protein D7D52_27495 [Nocardia yunnanensis]
MDAVERLRKKLESLKAAEAGSPEAGDAASNLTRLPRRPRRMSEEVSPRKTWQPEGLSAYDPAPTRPVLRSELQRETGWWPVDPGQAGFTPHTDAANGSGEDGSVIDLGTARRKRAAEDAPAAGIRRVAKPRRIGPAAGSDTQGHPTDGDS